MTTNPTPQTRRRWIRIAVSVVAVVALAIASFVALRSDSGSPTTHVAVGLGNVRRYAGPPLSLSPTVVTTPPSAEIGAPEDVDPDPTPPETPAEAIDCNFSFDPACGSWYWDPSPHNQPAIIDNVQIDPPNPIAGQTVTVTVTASDPDADAIFIDALFCSGEDQGSCPAPAPVTANPKSRCDRNPAGPWGLPEPRPGSSTQSFTQVYTEPGTYFWSVGVTTGLSTYPAFGQMHGPCSPFDPFVSGAYSSGTIVVASPWSPPA